TGTVGPTTINSGGTFAPGNSPGTITVAGNLAFQAGALYQVQVTPATASMANVSGSATLTGASVQAVFAPGSFLQRSHIILHSGGLGGTTFSGVSANVPPNFTASLSYTTTDVNLNLIARLGETPAEQAAEAAEATETAETEAEELAELEAAGLKRNQINVALALNNFYNSGGTLTPAFGAIFELTGSNLANALSQLSGEAATGAQQVAFQLTDQFLNLMLDPFVDGRSGIGGAAGPALGFAPEREALPEDVALAYAKAMKGPVYKGEPLSFERRWGVWAGGYGGYNKTGGDPVVDGSHDLSARVAGGAAGLDYHVTRDTVVGFALAGGGTNWSLADGLGGGKSDALQAGVYGATRSGPAYLAAAFAFANHWISTDRFAPFGDHLIADFNAQSYSGRAEAGYRFGMAAVGITPYAAIQAQSFHTPSYSETDTNGGGFPLAFNSRTATDTRSELGACFDRLVAFNQSAVLSLRARLAWARDRVSDPTLAAVFQTLPGASFVVNGATPAKDSALASAGAEYRLANGVILLAKFDGDFASHSSTYAGTGTIRYAW
ncbi:MAG TPA: autotransporter outer membrane beta-barrel domain-containing protein, partial [Xanthobacteraceae bacterium]